MKLSKHAKFWALGALGGVWLFALGVFAQQTLEINPSEQDLFSDLKAVFFLDRNGDEIKSIVRWNASGSTLVTAPTSELTGGEAKNTLQNNASIIGSTNSSNTSAGAFLIATNGGKVQWESMQSFIWGANNTTLSGFNTIAVATKDTNINADNALALASKNTNITAKDAIAIGWEDIKLKGQASLAIWSKIDSAAQGAMVFNAKNEKLNLNNESNNTFVINAGNGLIVNTNTSANPKIQLTVSGAIKLWEVNNAPAQASPYISTKKVGNVTCVCGKVNNGNIAISKYSRNNKQHAEICQKVCNNESPTLPGQCGAAATNYPLGQTQWSTDDFCQWGLGYAGAKPTFPALGGQTTWTCESFPSGGPTCTATRKGCWDGIRAAGEQCDLGTNNGKPDSNCSASCENVKAPKCWANAKSYLGSDVAWAQPNGFCTDGSVLGEATPAFWNGSTSWQKTWTCKNKNNKNLTCSAHRLPPAVAGVCGTTLNTCSAGTLSGQTSIAHGKRWSCDGLYGGSNKTCSRCDSGYKYNTTTNICEVACQNPIYRHTNGVTIKAADCAEAGKEYLFEGQKYYVARDKYDIQTKIAANTYPANRIVTTRVTDMNFMFYQNSSFNQDIGNWDTSKVTNMGSMFNYAHAFNQPLNSWDTSKVTNMYGMFAETKVFNQPLNNWDTSNVTDMSFMFYQAQAFNQPLNNWDTSKVTDMSFMFHWAGAFDQPLNNWDTSKVTTMSTMFANARAFNQPLNNWNTSKVTDMWGMFNYAQAFNQPLNNWDTSKVTDMSFMFHQNSSFNQDIGNWDTSKVTDMNHMFYWARAFNQLLNNRRINQIWDGNLKDMFTNATAFKANQPYCSWANWSAKKWNFVNMGLNDCPAAPTCPSWFTAYNGKCVKWECRATTVKPSLPAGCFPRFSGTSRKVSREEAVVRIWGIDYRCKNVEHLRVGPPPHALYERVFEACQKEAGKDIPYFEPNCRNQTARSSCESIRVGEIALCSWADEGQPRPPMGGVWYCPVGRCIPQLPPPPPWGAVGWTVKKAKCVSDSGEELEDALCPSSTRPNCQQVQTPPPPPGPPKLSKINGQCKAYPWTHTSQPATNTTNGCLAGDYEDMTDGVSSWKWKCKGKNGGTSTECSATKPTPIDGQCKIYPWSYASQPARNTANGCIAGDYEDDNIDPWNTWLRVCKGKNWWVPDFCSSKKRIDKIE